MPVTSYQSRNVYSPSVVPTGGSRWGRLPSSSIPSGIIGGALGLGGGVANTETARYIQLNGRGNPKFDTSTAGTLQPGDRNRVVRGYIRRADPNSSNPMSDTFLRFMYNPETVVQQYATYLDQAAIDPFNTVFQSGNLVQPPSVVQFDFQLLFDRQIEQANGAIPEGCMVDKRYFDMVVRNVSPATAGPSAVPDNGVMMVNPEDILVVFSENLTVQGRPINARMEYLRFANDMTPTRMAVSITMVVNYFGPLRSPTSSNNSQQVQDYESLIPYEDTLNPIGTAFSDIAFSFVSFKTNYSSNKESLDAQYASATPWWTVVPGGSSSEAPSSSEQALYMGAPVNDDIRIKALFAANALVEQGRQQFGGMKYSQAQRTKIPEYADCSSFVWKAYQLIGAQGVFGRFGWPNTASMYSFWKATNWATVEQVLVWDQASAVTAAQRLPLVAQPGDLLFIQSDGQHHISIVNSVTPTSLEDIAARSSSSNPQVGKSSSSHTSITRQFRMLLRPRLSGAQTSVGSVLGRFV